MAGLARRKFRGMVYEDPGFPPWFRQVTPIDVIERLNIGSRPASRRSGEGIENLRAILDGEHATPAEAPWRP